MMEDIVFFFYGSLVLRLGGSGVSIGGLGVKILRVVFQAPKNWAKKVPKKLTCFLKQTKILGGGNSNMFYFHPYLGKIVNLTNN